MGSAVTLEQEGSFVALRSRRMPIEQWKAYREAIEGSRYDRDRRCNLAPLDKVPNILRRLRESGFSVDVEPGLVRTLQEHTAQQWLDLKGAQERVERIDEELKARGQRLYPFQRSGVQWLATRHGALLADEMGLGKTIQAITAIPAGVPVLTISPAVAKGVWLREVAKWRPHLRVSVLSGRTSFRWPERGEMIVTNYDILPEIHEGSCKGKLPPPPCPGCNTAMNNLGMLVAAPGHKEGCSGFLEAADCPGCAKFLKLAPEDCVAVADEAHALKSGKAQRTRRFRALSEAIRSKRGRVWLLTATPLLNNPSELWSIYQAAGVAQEAFGSWKSFVSLFHGKPVVFGGYEWGTPEAEVAERIRRVSLRRMRAEVLPELPTKTYRELTVDVDRKALSECDRYLADNGGLERVVALIEAEGIKFETMSRVREALAKAKTAALVKLIDDIEAQQDPDAIDPLVVFSAHRFPIDLLKKRPGWQVITGDTSAAERTAIEDRFQRGELKGVAATIKAGGVAITLTRAHQAIFVDREFTPALNSQAEDRVCRIGQSRGVIITSLVADHQLDQRVTDLILKKQALIEASVNAARAAEEAMERATVDAEYEAEVKASQEEVRQGRVRRHFAESPREEWALSNLHRLAFKDSDKRLAFDLAEEATAIGLSDAQWALAVRVCKRYPEAGDCPGEAA